MNITIIINDNTHRPRHGAWRARRLEPRRLERPVAAENPDGDRPDADPAEERRHTRRRPHGTHVKIVINQGGRRMGGRGRRGWRVGTQTNDTGEVNSL